MYCTSPIRTDGLTRSTASHFLKTYSETPKTEATEQTSNQRKGSKPKQIGWVDQTVSESAIKFTRTTASGNDNVVY